MGWYLGFDCATKTFAFSLSLIDTTLFNGDLVREMNKLLAMKDKVKPEHRELISNKIKEYITRVKNSIIIEDGETVDLIPGKNDDETTQVERIKALTTYVKTRIPVKENMIVMIENQMGERANMIASALISLYADYEIVMVSPAIKNSIFFNDETRYGKFSQKYKSSYYANKVHACALFQEVKKMFTCKIKDEQSHVADSFLQIYAQLRNDARRKS